MSKISKVLQLILEVELTGDELEFFKCQQLSESLLEIINRAMGQENSTLRTVQSVKIKPGLTHADVQLTLAHLNRQSKKPSVGK